MRLLSKCLAVLLVAGCGPMTVVPDAGGGCRGPSKTPANLLENPGFECDSTPPEWSGIYGTLELAAGGRSGRAAKVTVNAAGGRMAYAKDFAVDAGTSTFCFSAFISGTAPFMRMRVLRTGPQTEVDQADQLFSDFRRTPLGQPLVVTNDNASNLQLVFEVQTNRTDGMNGKPGDVMLIDDVDVWESATNCSETR